MLRSQYPIHYIDAEYTPGKCSRIFEKHLDLIFNDNTTLDLTDGERTKRMEETRNYFLRILGYLLYAGNPEEIIVFLWGKGKNGKSKTIDVLREILGGEIAEASIKELYMSGEDKPRSGIKEALSKRVLFFSEASDDEDNRKGGRVSRDTVKNLTGEGSTSAFRGMHERSEQLAIICCPLAVTNELPRFDKAPDEALLRRIVTICFPHKITDQEVDPNITKKLLEEKDAIFSMVIDELLAYLRDGLLPLPEHCKAKQNELMTGVDISRFIETRLEKTDDRKEWLTRTEVLDIYEKYCDDMGIELERKKRVVGENEYGNVDYGVDLTKGEKQKLFNGLRVYGIEKYESNGLRYFKCRAAQ